MHVASFFCPICKCVVESFLAELGCCHYQLTPSTPTPSVPGVIFMHNTSIICSLVGGKSSLQVTCLNSSHIWAVSFAESYIYSLIKVGGGKPARRSQAPPVCKVSKATIACIYKPLRATDKSLQVWCTFAVMPADTRQRIRAACVCVSWLSAMQRMGLSSFAGCLRPQGCLLIFKHATLDLHQHCWEEHWCFILEDGSSKNTLNKLDFEVSQEGFENKSSNSRVSRKSLVPSGESFLPELFPEAV